jgi:hypothetical protein
MVRFDAPGPAMVIAVEISSGPLLSVIVCPSRPGENSIVSPAPALEIACRNDPAPLSALELTTSTDINCRVSSISKTARDSRDRRPKPRRRKTRRILELTDVLVIEREPTAC